MTGSTTASSSATMDRTTSSGTSMRAPIGGGSAGVITAASTAIWSVGTTGPTTGSSVGTTGSTIATGTIIELRGPGPDPRLEVADREATNIGIGIRERLD